MKKFFSSALFKGLVWQIAGWAVGAAFLTLIRVLMGLNPWATFGFTEPAWVFGGLVGALSFMAGSGIVTDWFKWAKGEETSEHHNDPDGWEKYFSVSLDHKVIGIQYGLGGLFFLFFGFCLMMCMRWQMACCSACQSRYPARQVVEGGLFCARFYRHALSCAGSFYVTP